jgi:hypothetical protein
MMLKKQQNKKATAELPGAIILRIMMAAATITDGSASHLLWHSHSP